MKNIGKILLLSLLILLLTACTNSQSEKSLSARDVFEKAKEASSKLEKVHTDLVFEDLTVPVEPEERLNVKYDIKSNASLQPLTVHQRTNVQASKATPWDMELYKVEDRVFVKDAEKKSWDELPPGSIAEIFGKIIAQTNPTLDLTLFDAYQDDFVLEPVDYGYALTLSMTKEQFKQFNENLVGPEEVDGDTVDKAFLLVDKLDFEIIIDKNTFFTTDFKMLTDVTKYVGRDSIRSKQKINAVYSRFNDIEDVKIPVGITDIAVN